MDLKSVLIVCTFFVSCCQLLVAGGQSDYFSLYRYRCRQRQLEARRLQNSKILSKLDPGQTKPSFLDPANFRMPDTDLNRMQKILEEIEMHIRPKDNNVDFYSGARLLIMLLQEECFKLRVSGDPRVRQFCNSFNNRYRSFFF